MLGFIQTEGSQLNFLLFCLITSKKTERYDDGL